MRFTNKRSSTSRRTPASSPSPVSEATPAVTPPQSDPPASQRAPANTPRPASETNVAPFVEPALSRRGPATTGSPASQDSSKANEPTFSDIPDELIAARAYELWQRRGCPMGHDSSEDWHSARAELEEERLGWAAPEPGDRDRI
jgi:hypothetical protein